MRRVQQALSMERALNQQLTGNLKGPPVAQRLAERGADGIDVEAMSINAWWYGANRDMARRICDVQNEKLMAMCKQAPDRLVAFGSVALQFPELAAEQLDVAMKQMGLKGAAIGSALVLVFMVGFFWGIIKIWGGANAISKGDSEGKGGILAGIIIAAAAAIILEQFLSSWT